MTGWKDRRLEAGRRGEEIWGGEDVPVDFRLGDGRSGDLDGSDNTAAWGSGGAVLIELWGRELVMDDSMEESVEDGGFAQTEGGRGAGMEELGEGEENAWAISRIFRMLVEESGI